MGKECIWFRAATNIQYSGDHLEMLTQLKDKIG